MTARRRPPLTASVSRPGPLLITFLIGGALVFLGLGLSGRIHWETDSADGDRVAAATPRVDRETTAAMLTAVLEPQAEWRTRGPAIPLNWCGEIGSDESLVQWNARVTALCERLGLEVIAGTEEIIERRGRWPLQRLTLVAALGGETLATLVVEDTRPPTVPPTF